IQNGVQLEAVEIKSGRTIQPDFFKSLNYLKKINPSTNSYVVYGGDQFQKRSDATVYGFNHLAKFNF
ncbi:MAG: AAA family ATPase, partial [Runella slithyformis]